LQPRFSLVAGLALLAACGGNASNQTVPFANTALHAPGVRSALQPGTKIAHIIVLVQENRSVDDLFQFMPGADTQSWGYDEKRQKVSLQPEALTAPYDLKHGNRPAWRTEYDHGAMDGFGKDPSHCTHHNGCPPPHVRAYGYVPKADVQPYYTLGEGYTFADRMFETSEGPSFPAHQYIVSGTSTTYDGSRFRVSENPGNQSGGCDSPDRTRVWLITVEGQQNHKAFPCFDRSSIFTLLDAAGISWKYYQAGTGAGIWHAVDALKPIWRNQREYLSNVVNPPSQVLTDISNGNLASVVFVTPTARASDHSGVTDGSGPSWVASVVNAVGGSQYWNSTAIVVTWDDWGGWYDHVKPAVRNSYELGFRVPMIVVSPYAKAGYVSHVPYEFGSILKFIEESFSLGSLGATDRNANDLADCFVFASPPRPFQKVAAKYSARYFLVQPNDPAPPDDE
jgi:phospholipase C